MFSIEFEGQQIELPALGYWKVKEAMAIAQLQERFGVGELSGFENITFALEVTKAFCESRKVEIDLEELPSYLLGECFNFFMNEQQSSTETAKEETGDSPKKQTGKKSSLSSKSTTQDQLTSTAGIITSNAA